MRRIPITPKIISIAKSYAQKMEDPGTFKTGESPKKRLLVLSDNLNKAGTTIKVLKSRATKGHPAVYTNHKGNAFPILSAYVKAIYDHYDGLNALLPSEYHDKISQYVDGQLAGYDINGIKVKLRGKKCVPFFELIVDAMRYDRVQQDIMPKYIKHINLIANGTLDQSVNVCVCKATSKAKEILKASGSTLKECRATTECKVASEEK